MVAAVTAVASCSGLYGAERAVTAEIRFAQAIGTVERLAGFGLPRAVRDGAAAQEDRHTAHARMRDAVRRHDGDVVEVGATHGEDTIRARS